MLSIRCILFYMQTFVFHRIFIASASTDSLYRSKENHGTAALLPKNSKEKEQQSSDATAKTNKRLIVSTEAATQPSKAPAVASAAGAVEETNGPIKAKKKG
jgi:hypothetical protein